MGQLAAKLGAVPWIVQLPTTELVMVVGFHTTVCFTRSVTAVCASVDRKVSKYHSKV